MALADDIINELRKTPGLTAVEIAMNLFGRRYPYVQAVRNHCRQLVDAGRLKRRGEGLQSNPFTYYLPRATEAELELKLNPPGTYTACRTTAALQPRGPR
jgi:hypothetical protein